MKEKTMSTIKRFEEIKAWQKARKATNAVYKITAKGDFSKDFGLRDQIRRACVSIMANIAEGFGRHSDRGFANFLSITHGSTAETQSHLYVALDLGYLAESVFSGIYDMLDEVSRMTLSLEQHLRNTGQNRQKRL
jgi:four helix bundle protein